MKDFGRLKKFSFRFHEPVSNDETENREAEAKKRYKHVMDMAGHIEKILPEIRKQYAINDRAQRVHHLTSGFGHLTFIFP